ncbi:MAG: hypothetical protein ABSB49_10540 [Polyangia bacterium]
MKRSQSVAVLLGVASTVLGLRLALAQTACPATPPACSDTGSFPNPVYLAGSSAFETVLSQLALQIKAQQNVSIIYSPISSCSGISSIYNDPALGLPGGTAPTVLTATPDYYIPNTTNPGAAVTCQCVLPGNTFASIGVSDVFFQSCQTSPMPATVGEWLGPEQAMLIVVPKANLTTTAISAEQAGAVFGCGQNGNFPPFIDNNAIFVRSATSGTQVMIGRNIGSLDASGVRHTVPETAFVGVSESSSTALFTALISYANPQAAIGILANDIYSTHRSQLNELAFRGLGQKAAYYGDSDPTSTDLINVREGRYMIQGPVHLFAPLQNGAPIASTQLVLNWLSGAALINPSDPQFYVRTLATNGTVPQCAMKVRISGDGGTFAPYTPPESCNCAFSMAKNLPIAAGTCKPCTTDADCSGSLRCQTSFCE